MRNAQLRRAVLTGMRPFMKDAELMAALTLWQEKYAGQANVNYTQFLAESCRVGELKGQRSAILGAIFNALNLPEKALLPDPLNQQTNQLMFAAQQTAMIDEKNIVFSTLVQNLIGLLPPRDAMQVKQYLVRHCKDKCQLAVQQVLALEVWVQAPNSPLEITLSVDKKRALVNLVYIALCQYIGPVKADQILSTGLKQSEAVAHQHQVDLHVLL